MRILISILVLFSSMQAFAMAAISDSIEDFIVESFYDASDAPIEPELPTISEAEPLEPMSARDQIHIPLPILSSTTPTLATPLDVPLPPQPRHSRHHSYDEKYNQVQNLDTLIPFLKECRCNSDEIVVVFDMNGTLINKHPGAVRPIRLHAKEIIHELNNLGVKLIATSEDPHFYTTYAQIHYMDLLEEFRLPHIFSSVGEKNALIQVQESRLKLPVTYLQLGLVTSVRLSSPHPMDGALFSKKALAPILTLSSEELESLKCAVFVNDDYQDLVGIHEDIKFFKAFPDGIQIKYFHLLEETRFTQLGTF